MCKRVAVDRRAALVVSVAVAAMTGSAASVAGPGCMGNQQHPVDGYYRNSPMMPQAAYRPGPPAAYRAVPAPYMRTLAPSYPRPMFAQRANPSAVARPAASAPVDTVPLSSNLHAASSESESAGENITVRINGMSFEPSSISVEPGTTVT